MSGGNQALVMQVHRRISEFVRSWSQQQASEQPVQILVREGRTICSVLITPWHSFELLYCYTDSLTQMNSRYRRLNCHHGVSQTATCVGYF